MRDIKTINGEKRILVSAPHAFLHRRPNLLDKYKLGEQYTDEIVKEICARSDSFGIYSTGKLDYDPNYHKIVKNPFKKEVEKIIEVNKIKSFIDIHGLKNLYDIDIVIFYKSRFFKSIALAYELIEYINRGLLCGLNIQILKLVEDDRESLSEYVATQLRVPSIQIEIARYIREDKKLRECLIENISEYIKVKM